MTSLRLSPAHRDVLYEYVLDRLSGINDVWLAVQAGDYQRATQLGQEYADYLCLILEDLGWGDGPGEAVELSAPPDVLRRVLARLQDLAEGLLASEAGERAELLKREERGRLVIEACQTVLMGLDP